MCNAGITESKYILKKMLYTMLNHIFTCAIHAEGPSDVSFVAKNNSTCCHFTILWMQEGQRDVNTDIMQFKQRTLANSRGNIINLQANCSTATKDHNKCS